MDFFRLAASAVIDVVNTIAEGGKELYDSLNPRKRRRSSSTSLPSTTVPPQSSSARRNSSPSLFPSPYRSQQHAHNDVTEQPQQKRRRVSFTPEPEHSSPFVDNPQQQQVPPDFAIRRSSSGLQDALAAPTPPALAFHSRYPTSLSMSPRMSTSTTNQALHPFRSIHAPTDPYLGHHRALSNNRHHLQQQQQQRLHRRSSSNRYPYHQNTDLRTFGNKRPLSYLQQQQQQQYRPPLPHARSITPSFRQQASTFPYSNLTQQKQQRRMSHKQHQHRTFTISSPTAPAVAAAPASSPPTQRKRPSSSNFRQHQQQPTTSPPNATTENKAKSIKPGSGNRGGPASFKVLAARRDAQVMGRPRISPTQKDSSVAELLTMNKKQSTVEEEIEDEKEEEKKRRESVEKLDLKLSRSKKKSSEIFLELFVKQQQRLQDQKRREEAQRVLHESTSRIDLLDSSDDDDDDSELGESDQPEVPPTNATHWDTVYWCDDDENSNSNSWMQREDEGSDSDAMEERRLKVTCQENGQSAFAPLTKSALKRLRRTLSNKANEHTDLVKINGCVITGGDLRHLQPNSWLNDEIVNAYTSLLVERNERTREELEKGGGDDVIVANGEHAKENGVSHNRNVNGNDSYKHGAGGGGGGGMVVKKKKKRNGGEYEERNGFHQYNYNHNYNSNHHTNLSSSTWSKTNSNNSNRTKIIPPKVKMMNSFFYAKLVEFDRRKQCSVYNYQRVRRWTRRFDVFSYDLMLIPINQQNLHWTLGVIDFSKKTVCHLDSMATGGDPNVCQHLLDWVRDEARERGKFEHEWSKYNWTALTSVTVPFQQNGDDCGVFLCKFADFLTRGWGYTSFSFTQQHMTYFRARIAHELLMGKAT